MLRSTIIHLRIPFSVFLLPVFLFALSQSGNVRAADAWVIFVLLHFFLYPASNAYNSYYDKDEGSIGTIRQPPPVTRALLYTAWALDLAAVVIAWMAGLSTVFIVYLVVYGCVSKAYSHPRIRLKKYPILSLLTVSIFQGLLTYMAVRYALDPVRPAAFLPADTWLPAVIATTNLLAVYPITQVYQHAEDKKRGDMTFSRMVGVQGTFLSAAAFFSLSFLGFAAYFLLRQQENNLLLLTVCMSPVVLFFAVWWRKVARQPSLANYSNTMYMNTLASVCLNIYFGLLCIGNMPL